MTGTAGVYCCFGLLITLFFAYQLRYLKVGTNFEDLLPQNHPYIKVHNQIRTQFGGANQVLLMLQVRKGDIFNQKTLKKVQEITEKARTIHGVDPDKIQSIATRRAKHAEITSGVISFDYLMFPDVPQNSGKDGSPAASHLQQSRDTMVPMFLWTARRPL